MSTIVARCLAAVSCLAVPLLHVSAADVYSVELERLASDVYLVRRPEPLREPVEANALFVVNAGDVVVFEGGGAPIVAERTIALIRSVSARPRRASATPASSSPRGTGPARRR